MSKALKIVSGMRPTGKLHIGHLLGALDKWVELQNEGNDCNFFVADLHALTTGFDQSQAIPAHIMDMTLDWLASGLDPEKSSIFVQSLIPGHSELFLLFSMITPLGWLERNPTYKEQKQELRENETSHLGFLGYPVMQTADICLYKGEGVPVGQDQVPHLELSREIVRRFNSTFGDMFPEPKAILTPTPKINGTDGRKMSKSYNNALLLSDNEDELQSKIRSMVTDPKRVRRNDPGDPGSCNLFPLHLEFSSNQDIQEVRQGCTSASMGCVDCKKKLLPSLSKRLLPIQEKRSAWEKRSSDVKDILQSGSEKANLEAQKNLAQAKELIHLHL